jgi:hypothetical protein
MHGGMSTPSLVCVCKGLAKLECKPWDEFMRLYVAAYTARSFEGFMPKELASVIIGEEQLVFDLRKRIRHVGRTDTYLVHGRPGEAGAQAWGGVHEAVCGGMHGGPFRGLQPSGAGERDER